MDNFWKNGKSFFTFALVIAAVGTVWLVTSRAGSGYLSFEAMNEQLTVTSDEAAGGSYISFEDQNSGEYSFVPQSLEDWEFAPQNTYTASNVTRYVAVDGSSGGDGTNRNAPISLDHSIVVAQPGDVIYLAPGTYRQRLYINGLKGTVEKPIVFTTELGNARKAIISHDNYNIARIISSDSLVFDSLTFDGNNGTIWGVVFGASFVQDTDTGPNTDITFIGNEIRNNKNEATLKVRKTDGAVVHNNYIHDSGNPGTGGGQGYGEGMYIGCGGCPSEENTTRNVVVTYNKVQNVAGEGIEFKPGVRNITATDNLVLDTGFNQRYGSNGSQCCYGAGIVVHPVSNTTFNTNAKLGRNRVGRTTAHGIFAGAGNTEVSNNLVWQTGVNHRLGLQTTVAREPFATSNWHNGSFDTISFVNNHTFGHSTSVLKDDNNYGNTSAQNQKANIIKREITKHQSEQDAFSAWRDASF